MKIRNSSILLVLIAFCSIMKAVSFQEGGPMKNLEYFKRALELSGPNRAEVLSVLVRTTYGVLTSGEPIEIKQEFLTLTITEYERYLSENPEDVMQRYIFGSFESDIGLFQAAVTTLEKAAAISPKNQLILIQLSLAYARSGDFAKAKAIMEEVKMLDPLKFNQQALLEEIDKHMEGGTI
jgi:tetratricopeptide (TPR) repeat protein